MSRWELRRGEALWELRTLEAQSVDAIITDPPYSSGGFTRGDRMAKPGKKYEQTGLKQPRAEFAGDNRDQRSFAYWCALWLAECLRVAKPGAPIAIFTDWRQLPSTTDALQGSCSTRSRVAGRRASRRSSRGGGSWGSRWTRRKRRPRVSASRPRPRT